MYMHNEQNKAFYYDLFREAFTDGILARNIKENLKSLKRQYPRQKNLEYYLKRRIIFFLQQANEKWCKAHLPSLFHNLAHLYDFCVDNFPEYKKDIIDAIAHVLAAHINIKLAKHDPISNLKLIELFTINTDNKGVVIDQKILATAFDYLYQQGTPDAEKDALKNESLNLLEALNKLTKTERNLAESIELELNNKKIKATELDYILSAIGTLHQSELVYSDGDNDIDFFFKDLIHIYSHLFLAKLLSNYEQPARYPVDKKINQELKHLTRFINPIEDFTFDTISNSYSNASLKDSDDDIKRINSLVTALNLKDKNLEKFNIAINSLLKIDSNKKVHFRDIISDL